MTDVRMPKLGESVTEGTVSRWLKRAGDAVALREPLLEISTDKIDTEIPSPAGGTLVEILIAEGETVPTGTVLARIGDTHALAGTHSPPHAAPAPTELDHQPQGSHPNQHAIPRGSMAAAATPAAGNRTNDKPTMGRAYLSPVVQRMAAEHHVDLASIEGTGLGGRITKKDMLAWLERSHSATPVSTTPLSAMRRAIAQHMSESVRTAPHVASVFEVNMSAVVRHREEERTACQRRGIRLTYTAYFVHVVAHALRKHPQINDRFTEQGIVHNPHVHMGVAVALGTQGDAGLIVPVLRNADELTLHEVARALEALTERARAGTLQPDDLQGGTFTLTNHGVSGSLIGTPIIVQPQSAILGVGAIVKRAVVRSAGGSLLPSADDAIAIRPMCYLTLSFDHRIIDGATADAFLRDVQYQLEAWTSPVPERA